MNKEIISFDTYRRLLEVFKELVLDNLKDSLISLVLYGSVARGEAKRESDIDLLIIQRNTPEAYYKRLQPLIEAWQRLKETSEYKVLVGKRIIPYLSFLILSEEEAKENRYIFLDMIDGSIVLYDKEGFFEKKMVDIRNRLQTLGSRRVVLPDGSWYWDLKPDLIPGEAFEL